MLRTAVPRLALVTIAVSLALLSTSMIMSPAGDAQRVLDQASSVAVQLLHSEPLQPFGDPDRLQCIARRNPNLPEVVNVYVTRGGIKLGWVYVDIRHWRPIVLDQLQSANRYVDLRHITLLSAQDAWESAQGLVARHWPKALQGQVKRPVSQAEVNNRGCFEFRWSRRTHGIETFWLEVEIRAWDGKVQGFHVYEIDPASISPPSVSAEDALAAVLQAVRRETGWDTAQLEIVGPTRHREVVQDHVQYYWEAHVLRHEDGRTGCATARVLEPTGEVLGVDLKWERASPAGTERIGHEVSDYGWPTWSPDGKWLVSRATRLRWSGYPTWEHNVPTSLTAIRVSNGETRLLRPVTEFPWPSIWYQQAAFPGNNRDIVVTTRDEYEPDLCVVELGAGNVSSYNFRRHVPIRSFDARGRLICLAARMRRADDDIAIVAIPNSPETPLEYRSLAVEGPDCCPVFSPTEDSVYFAHRCASAEGECAWQLMRSRVEDEATLASPEVIAEGLGPVGRISVFPDGGKLLVWHDDTLVTVTVSDGEQTPITLGELRDPDFPDWRPVTVSYPAIGPDGDTIAFVGRLWSGAEDEPPSYHIYVCRLDGTELRRLTPMKPGAVQPYVYPESGAEALRIADPSANFHHG